MTTSRWAELRGKKNRQRDMVGWDCCQYGGANDFFVIPPLFRQTANKSSSLSLID